MKDKEEIREFIRKNYTEVALKGSEGGCCGGGFDCFLAQTLLLQHNYLKM